MRNDLKRFVSIEKIEKPPLNELIAFKAKIDAADSWKALNYVNGPVLRDCYCLDYCIAGKGTVILNGNEYPLKAGQALMIFPSHIITLISSKDDPWQFAYIYFQGTKAAEYLSNFNITELSPFLSVKDGQELLQCISRGAERLLLKDSTLLFKQKALAYELFTILGSICPTNDIVAISKSSPKHYINKAIQYVQSDLAKHTKISDIAKHVGLTQTYFSTLFTKEVGQSPQAFFTDYRIKKACTILTTNSEVSISNIAYSLGYDPLIFSRVFKQIVGQSPREYRKSIPKE